MYPDPVPHRQVHHELLRGDDGACLHLRRVHRPLAVQEAGGHGPTSSTTCSSPPSSAGCLGAKIHYLILHPSEWPGNLLSGGGPGLVRRAVRRHHRCGDRHLAVQAEAGGDHGRRGHRRRPWATRSGAWAASSAATTTGSPRISPGACPSPTGCPPTTVKVHPTQLYEIAASLVIFALLVWVISPRFKREGPLMFVYAASAGVERFLVEFVRDEQRPVALGITSAAVHRHRHDRGRGHRRHWYFATRGRLRPRSTRPPAGRRSRRQGRCPAEGRRTAAAAKK